MDPVTAEEAYAVCEGIAGERAGASVRTAYGDGYRAAAEHIVTAIRARRTGSGSSDLERDLRDAEVEARTFARVIEAAVAVVEETGRQTDAADAVRMLVGGMFSEEDLPPILRKRERASSPRISEHPRSTESRTQRALTAGRLLHSVTPFR